MPTVKVDAREPSGGADIACWISAIAEKYRDTGGRQWDIILG